MSEVLIAVLVVVIPVVVLAIVGVGSRLMLNMLSSTVTRFLAAPIAPLKAAVDSLLQMARETKLEQESIRKDVTYLRNNGRDVKERLQQGAVETENVREDIRQFSRDLNKHVNDEEAHA